MPDHSILLDLLILFLASLPFAVAMRALGQSTIVGYLLTGLAIGPGGLGLVHEDSIQVLAEVGVGLLLFTVGLELPLARFAAARRVTILGGGLQVAATAAIFGLAVAWATGRPAEGAFIGCAVALSSSAIVLKTLSDRGDLDAPYAMPATAVAVFQDLATVPMMVVLPALARGGSGEGELWSALLAAMGRAAALLVVLYLGAHYLVHGVLYTVARTRSPEVFVLAVVALLLGAAYGASAAGLSLALGAFVAGILLAESPFAHQITAEVTPFKGVFQSVFFVSIGMLLEPRWVAAHWPLVAGAAAAVIGGKAVLAGGAIVAAGVPERVAAAAGILLSNVGEFSFVLIALGRREGVVSDDVYQLTLAASFASMAIAPPLIANARAIVDALARAPGLGRRLAGAPDEELAEAAGKLSGHVIIGGFGPVGRDVATFLLDHGVEFVAIDLNPRSVREHGRRGVPIFFGDFSNPLVLELAGAARARALVISAPDHDAAARAVRHARQLNPGAQIVVRTKYRTHVGALLEAGASEVVEEEFQTALEMVARLGRALSLRRSVVAEHMAGQRLERFRMMPPSPAEDVPEFDVEVIRLDASSPLTGKTIAEADVRGRTGATVLAVRRGAEQVVNPPPTWTLGADDRLACVGTDEQLDAVAKLARGDAAV